MKTILLCLVATVLLRADSVVIDPSTALMWQDVPENRGTLHTWQDAKDYCDLLCQDDFDDWWLPAEEELSTIIDTSRPDGRKIQQGFTYYKAGEYWTSSTYAWNAPDAWVIDFGQGISLTLAKEEYRFVRCVRCSDFKKCLELFYEK